MMSRRLASTGMLTIVVSIVKVLLSRVTTDNLLCIFDPNHHSFNTIPESPSHVFRVFNPSSESFAVLIQIMRFFRWVWSEIPLVVDWNWFNKLALGLIAVFDFLPVVANFLRQAGRAPDSFKDAMFIVEMVLKFLSYALTTAVAILKPRIKPEDGEDLMTDEDYKQIIAEKDEFIARLERDNKSQEKEIKYLHRSKQQVIKENVYFLSSIISSEGSKRTNK